MTKTEAKEKYQAGEIQICYDIENVDLLKWLTHDGISIRIESYYHYKNTWHCSVMDAKHNLPIINLSEITESEELNTPKHYDNSKGTLYKVAQERGWNAYLFDIVKRLERAEKKGEFDSDLGKSINVIKLWKNEANNQK